MYHQIRDMQLIPSSSLMLVKAAGLRFEQVAAAALRVLKKMGLI